MILFRKYKPEKLSPITFYGKELILSTQVKYLGVILDPKLNWQLHLDAIVYFFQLRGSIGKTIPGLFVPLHFRSRERKVHRENFRSYENVLS